MKHDTAETVNISALALLKMLKHGRAGVPLEVMGLMLGRFVDDYTIEIADVFAMPQSGTGVSVEAVDEVYQTEFMNKLSQTGRRENVVGWYHSHPGFGCWLSNVDVNTAISFEQLNPRSVSVVVDPIQSVKGKIVIDAFRTIPKQALMMNVEPRQTTSNIGFLNKPTLKALMHGLGRSYYSINIDYRRDELVEEMLLNLKRRQWYRGLTMPPYRQNDILATETLTRMTTLTQEFAKNIDAEKDKTEEELKVERTGKIDPKRHLAEAADKLIDANVMSSLGTMLDTVIF